jgi:heme A synthase
VLLGTAAVRLVHDEGGQRQAARAILGLLVIEVALGVLTVLSGLHLWLVLAHGLCAAALLASVATLLRR